VTSELRGELGWYTLRGAPVEGGQAQVWRASSADGMDVAVKRALPSARFMRAVVDEARSMRELAQRVPDAQRWFVPVLDEGSDALGLPFYVMPWFDGTLADLLVAATPLGERLDLLVQAALALELLHRSAAHGRVFVHRDVKPHNFLVRRVDGRLRVALADFGIARDEDMLVRQTRTVMLSMSYAPPEQYLPLRAEPDASVDVFALAAMVFEGLTLAPPPRVAARATEWHGPDADVLQRLYANRARLGPEEQVRLEQLRARPVRSLLRADAGPPLLPEEIGALRAALAAVSDAAVGDALTDLLAPVLARSLEPDPMHRLGSASSLRKALQEAWERLVGADAEWSAPAVWAEASAAVGELPVAGAAATTGWGDDDGGGPTITPTGAGAERAGPREEPGPTMVPSGRAPSAPRAAEGPVAPSAPRAAEGPVAPAVRGGGRALVGVALVMTMVGLARVATEPTAPAPAEARAVAPSVGSETPAEEAPAMAAPAVSGSVGEAPMVPIAAPPRAAPSPVVAPPVAAPPVAARSAPEPSERPAASSQAPSEVKSQASSQAPTSAPTSTAAVPPPVADTAPAQVIVSVSIEGYSMMAHGWDGGGAAERGSSLRTLRPGPHSLELFHAGEVQRRVPVVVRERDGELVAEVGDAGARVTCRASQGRIGVVVHVATGPRCRP
jgi:serine/threonine protein kinase